MSPARMTEWLFDNPVTANFVHRTGGRNEPNRTHSNRAGNRVCRSKMRKSAVHGNARGDETNPTRTVHAGTSAASIGYTTWEHPATYMFSSTGQFPQALTRDA
jgi:hypothetical protein